MKILTVENQIYDLDTVPDEIEDIRYCVLDASEKDEVDFFFLPLIFLESFHSPAICLEIGGHRLQVPMDWCILVCDDDYSALEIIPLATLNHRGFSAVAMNPMVSSTLANYEINITNIFQDVKWYFPKLKNGHLLAVPLENKPNPRCVYFVKEANKVSEFGLSDLL